MFRSSLFVALFALFLPTLVGCGSNEGSGGKNTYADMTEEEWAEFNANEERMAAEDEKEMMGE